MSSHGARRARPISPFAILAVTLATGSCTDESGQPAADSTIEAPVARVIPAQLETHGHTRIDNYYWLNQRENPEVISYLEAENEYTGQLMAHTEGLQGELFDEIKGRIKQTDLSVPFRDGPYFYYSRTVEGLNYSIFCRKRGSLEADEEIILDINELAEGHDYFRVTSRDLTPDHRYLAYSVDTTGYETGKDELTTCAHRPQLIDIDVGKTDR